jgi:hypothetical protein
MFRWHGMTARGFCLIGLSFVIYGYLVLTIPQIRNSPYCCEQSSVAAAVSHRLYGTPLGALNWNVLYYFLIHIDEPLETVLDGVGQVTPGVLFKTTRDGNGVGYPLVATIAIAAFGLHTWALTLFMLVLMLLASIAFLWRFPRLGYVVLLYFCVLTVMLFTPLVWNHSYQANFTVAGVRYYSLAGVLPAVHIILEFLDSKLPKKAVRDYFLLGLQTAILILVVLVRGSAIPAFAMIAVVALAVAWRQRCWRYWWRRQEWSNKINVIGAVIAVLLLTIAFLMPPYLNGGRFGTVIWQRVTESIGVHPRWPFPGAQEMFPCREWISQGLESGPSDINGACIWFSYLTDHYLRLGAATDQTFGTMYETALREAFFAIAARYPKEVLEAFLYYKPRLIIPALIQDLDIRLNHYSPQAVCLLFLSLALAFVYFNFEAVQVQEFRRIIGVTTIAGLFTLPAYIAAWAAPHTVGDLLFYCLFLALCGLTYALRILRVGAQGKQQSLYRTTAG